MSTATHIEKLTKKQLTRMEELAQLTDEPRVVGYDERKRGPIIQFVTGGRYVITRDGGLDRA